MKEAGQEGYWLLDQIEAHGSDELKTLAKVKQLRRMLAEQFTRGKDSRAVPRPPSQAKGDVVTSPHDPEARYGKKGEQGWVGLQASGD